MSDTQTWHPGRLGSQIINSVQIDGLVQERRNSSAALAMELTPFLH